jgi:hypothetical protein
MNDTNEMSNLPWQALQKNLAERMGAPGIVHGAVPRGPITQRNAPSRRRPAEGSGSWLSRARCRGAPLPTL